MITIGVIAHVADSITLECLQAVADWTTDYEFVGVLNGAGAILPNSAAKLVDLKNALPPGKVRILNYESLTHSSVARNAVYTSAAAASDLIAYIDNDVVVCDGWQAAFMAPFSNPDVVIVGYDAMTLSDDFELQYSVPYGTPYDYFDSPYMVRKSFLDTLGGFDTALGMVAGNNTDIMVAAQIAEKYLARIVNPGVNHYKSTTKDYLGPGFVAPEILISKARLVAKYTNNWPSQLTQPQHTFTIDV